MMLNCSRRLRARDVRRGAARACLPTGLPSPPGMSLSPALYNITPEHARWWRDVALMPDGTLRRRLDNMLSPYGVCGYNLGALSVLNVSATGSVPVRKCGF